MRAWILLFDYIIRKNSNSLAYDVVISCMGVWFQCPKWHTPFVLTEEFQDDPLQNLHFGCRESRWTFFSHRLWKLAHENWIKASSGGTGSSYYLAAYRQSYSKVNTATFLSHQAGSLSKGCDNFDGILLDL